MKLTGSCFAIPGIYNKGEEEVLWQSLVPIRMHNNDNPINFSISSSASFPPMYRIFLVVSFVLNNKKKYYVTDWSDICFRFPFILCNWLLLQASIFKLTRCGSKIECVY